MMRASEDEIDEEEIVEASESCDESERIFHRPFKVFQVDVTNENHITQAANHVKQKYGNLDLLINNAGLLHPSGKGETRHGLLYCLDLLARNLSPYMTHWVVLYKLQNHHWKKNLRNV